ncbi:bifunctional DNA-formamidopyrimidine glycosylase/DNA-(apurinic or apyrimidinic site) lyase [Okibacterium endophyticum]
MPELPEVEVVRAGLAPAVTGARITSVEVLDDRSVKRHNPISGSFEEVLHSRVIEGAVRRGKFLWFPLRATGADDIRPVALVTHLGMSGQMLLREPGVEDRLTRIRLGIEHPEHGELCINFVDQRIFGGMAIDGLITTADSAAGGFSGRHPGTPVLPAWHSLIPDRVAHIARDPLDPAFDQREFVRRLGRRASGIKRAMLDQTLVSGIGNIYADEALWAARLHFDQPANTLSARKIAELMSAVRQVLEKALAEGGTSFDAQYVNVNGASGYFAHSLNAYGRQGLACARCGTVMERVAFMNRSSHYCPRCQRLRPVP